MNLNLSNIKSIGISLLCNTQGKIIELLCDEIGLDSKIHIDQLFITVFDFDSREKAANFVVELKQRGVTLDWPLSITVNEHPVLLHFSGGMNGNNMFIVGTKTPASANQFFEELMRINNEQANKLRQAVKEQVKTAHQNNQDGELYEELSQLNNELANTQRELSKKNMQLQHQRKDLEKLNATLLTTIAELHQTRDELAQSEKMASLGRLVSGFAHELNTPIGIAVGSASALQGEARKIKWILDQEEIDVDELLSAVDGIDSGFELTLSNLERAGNLISSFKRTAVDQTSGELRSFSVLEVIQDTLNTLNNHFKKTEITIQVSCPSDLKIVSLPGALEQILTNLLMNSLIHGFDEGKRSGEIHIEAHLQAQQLQLIYTDNGCGMSAENLEKIFEPFFTTHRAHGGTGLGAYICYNLVTTQLKGNITCHSQLEQGVKFDITYPVALELIT